MGSPEQKQREKNSLYIRNIVFGVEDSLVSTVGLLSGIAAANASYAMIFLTGVVYICVEAFSMAVGSFLSEEFAEEYIAGGGVSLLNSLLSGVVMFASFAVAGLIPLLPYVLFPEKSPVAVSVLVSMVTLFFVGIISARISHTKPLRRGVRMLVFTGLAILIGIVVGRLAPAL